MSDKNAIIIIAVISVIAIVGMDFFRIGYPEVLT